MKAVGFVGLQQETGDIAGMKETGAGGSLAAAT